MWSDCAPISPALGSAWRLSASWTPPAQSVMDAFDGAAPVTGAKAFGCCPLDVGTLALPVGPSKELTFAFSMWIPHS